MPSACSPSSVVAINNYRALFYQQLQPAQARSNMHFYIDTCLVHAQNLRFVVTGTSPMVSLAHPGYRYCDGGDLHGWNCVGWTEHAVMGTTPKQAFTDFYLRNVSTVWIDTAAYPTNPSCVSSPNPPTSHSDPFLFDPTAPSLPFAGYSWLSKQGFGGPGPNVWWSNGTSVAADGLHIKLQDAPGSKAGFACAEVTLNQSLGYGNYSFSLAGSVDSLGQGDPHVVLGLFLYRDDQNELDIEMARWGNATAGQCSVPCRLSVWG